MDELGAHLLRRTTAEWRAHGGDLWVFGYASLIWRPEFDFLERRPARVHGWHRALRMWSRVNRGTPECPGLVFCLLAPKDSGVDHLKALALVSRTMRDPPTVQKLRANMDPAKLYTILAESRVNKAA